MQFDVFLCYDPVDRESADKIREAFVSEGVTCTDRSSLTATTSLKNLIGSCKALVLIVSDSTMADDSNIIMQVETAIKLNKVIISYSAAEKRFGESFGFLMENSIEVKAEESEESLGKLINMVKSVKEKQRKAWKKKLTILGVILGIVIVLGCAALMLVFILNPKPTDSGSTGECTWRYYEGSKTLMIAGNGGGADYSEGTAPWQQYADNIETVTVENGVTSIGAYSCYKLTDLKKVDLPDSLESIGAETFKECPKLTEIDIPEYVFTVSGGAVTECPITSLCIPAGVNFITGPPCYNCAELEEFTVDKDNSYYCADSGVLLNYDKTCIIQCPAKKTGSYKFPETVHTIGSLAFVGCSKLESVTFSEQIEEIPKNSFFQAGLKKLELPESVVSVDDFAFMGCEQIETVTLPQHLETIGTGSFYQCTALKEIVVPDSVTEIGQYALSFADVNDEISVYPLTIKGGKGSAAQKYAKENDLDFQITE